MQISRINYQKIKDVLFQAQTFENQRGSFFTVFAKKLPQMLS
jgi:hypothetical protein